MARLVTVEEPTVTKSKEGVAGPDFSIEHAHCFFYMKWIIYCEFVPPNTTVTSDFHCDVLRCLKENM
jgi:hypothetical protein